MSKIRVALDTDQPEALAARADVLITYADLMTHALFVRLDASWPDIALVDRGLGDPLDMASIADIEPGALSVAAGVSRIRSWSAAGRPYVTAYADRSLMPQVITDLGALHPFLWYSTLDGQAHIIGRPAGFEPALVQCLSAADLGFHADLSLVYEQNWRPSPQIAELSKSVVHIGQLMTTAANAVVHAEGDLGDLPAVIKRLM